MTFRRMLANTTISVVLGSTVASILVGGCAPTEAALDTSPPEPPSRYAIKLIDHDGYVNDVIDYYCDKYELLSNHIIIEDKVTHKQVIIYGASVAIEER